MLQIPLSFKGPKDLISRYFSEETVFSAFRLLLQNHLQNRQHKQAIELISAEISDQVNIFSVSITWPLDIRLDVPIGNCNCKNPKPCVHICALLLDSKARLDKIPPFTGQLQANRNIQQTLLNWIGKQHHDPYPNMARHRMIYVLDCDENEETFTLSLHKAYLTKEDKYIKKSSLDSSVADKKPLAKFITLTDQVILKQLNKQFPQIQPLFDLTQLRNNDLLQNIFQSGRCFWKNCYRPPLNFEETEQVSKEMLKISNQFYIAIYQNTVFQFQQNQQTQRTSQIIDTKKEIIPKLSIQTVEIHHNLLTNLHHETNIAKVTFLQNQKEFSFQDLSDGKIHADVNLLEMMARHLRQIEKLDSMYAHFELILLKEFHINDRYLDVDFREFVLLLVALKHEGWQIEIHKSFKLKQVKANNWYANVTSQDKQSNWFDLELGVMIDGQQVNILPFLVKAIKTGKFDINDHSDLSIKLEDGTNIGIQHHAVRQILSTLTELYDEKSLNKNNRLQFSSNQIIRLSQVQKSLEQNSETPLQWSDEFDFSSKSENLSKINQLQDINPPENLKASLRHYQLNGISWLQFLRENELGGILADDMGLGKTIQVLAHLLHEKNHKRLKKPCLIIVPTSLLSNWQDEINKFTPQLNTITLSGTNRHKFLKNIEQYDIVITSYGTFNRDVKKLKEYNFYYLILDEAQTIKNSKTQIAKAVSAISSDHRLCLTGTPIENHLGELWSLFNFLMPGFLGSLKQFETIYKIPIEKQSDTDRQADLRKRVEVFMLRRTKQQVAKELPAKTEIIQMISLLEEQTNLYESVRLSMSDAIRKAVNQSNNSNKLLISNALLRLRQICCHPKLLNIDNITNESAKLRWLETVLPNMIEEGRKILLFSSFTKMLRIIKDFLDELKISSLTLTGSTPSNKRGQLIEEFQKGNTDVFLISLKAGGAGINLTRADTVIHFDPWWNPAAESQASDRSHRIGQKNNVFVYKLISKGTVEEKIHNLQKQKNALSQSIFDQKGNISQILNDANWQELFKPIE
ncbi:MAG: DEAD/DEAH box helicase [Gammaproteobacteria bacterium]